MGTSVVAEGERGIAIARRFPAAPERVFRAFTDPALLRRWMGPRGWTLVECVIDLRPGGSFRYAMRRGGGGDMAWHGRFLEVVPPRRIVLAESFPGWFEGEAIVTTTLAVQGEATLFSASIQYPAASVRDGVLASPMPAGLEESHARLDAVLAGPA